MYEKEFAIVEITFKFAQGNRNRRYSISHDVYHFALAVFASFRIYWWWWWLLICIAHYAKCIYCAPCPGALWKGMFDWLIDWLIDCFQCRSKKSDAEQWVTEMIRQHVQLQTTADTKPVKAWLNSGDSYQKHANYQRAETRVQHARRRHTTLV